MASGYLGLKVFPLVTDVSSHLAWQRLGRIGCAQQPFIIDRSLLVQDFTPSLQWVRKRPGTVNDRGNIQGCI